MHETRKKGERRTGDKGRRQRPRERTGQEEIPRYYGCALVKAAPADLFAIFVMDACVFKRQIAPRKFVNQGNEEGKGDEIKRTGRNELYSPVESFLRLETVGIRAICNMAAKILAHVNT